MPRRMADKAFREEQWAHRYDDHVAPLNRLVDELGKSGALGSVPYIAPMYGGVNARLLSILRDPGPKTQSAAGSGFLSMENDDATAETICGLFADAAIDAKDIVPWNSYPWYINRDPKAAELDAGVMPLKQVVDLLPRLRVVMLHGAAARNSWIRFLRRYPDLVDTRGLQVIQTYHTSRQAFWHKDPTVREERKQHLRKAFSNAAAYLRGDVLVTG